MPKSCICTGSLSVGVFELSTVETGVLYATSADTMGGLNPRIGVLRPSDDRVLRHLTGRVSPAPRQQAQALATVLHEATHGGMLINAAAQPNAVLTVHSRGLMEGVAEARTSDDFELFVKLAGYRGLTFGAPRYPGGHRAPCDGGLARTVRKHQCGANTGRQSERSENRAGVADGL